jgi:hypothetical protein
MYERMGLRVTAYKEPPPEIELTLDPDALPSTNAASEVLDEAKKVARSHRINIVQVMQEAACTYSIGPKKARNCYL